VELPQYHPQKFVSHGIKENQSRGHISSLGTRMDGKGCVMKFLFNI
jgi:hypothetical protein